MPCASPCRMTSQAPSRRLSLGVLRHALIEPAWDAMVLKTNKFAKDNVGQLMRQGLLQEG